MLRLYNSGSWLGSARRHVAGLGGLVDPASSASSASASIWSSRAVRISVLCSTVVLPSRTVIRGRRLTLGISRRSFTSSSVCWHTKVGEGHENQGLPEDLKAELGKLLTEAPSRAVRRPINDAMNKTNPTSVKDCLHVALRAASKRQFRSRLGLSEKARPDKADGTDSSPGPANSSGTRAEVQEMWHILAQLKRQLNHNNAVEPKLFQAAELAHKAASPTALVESPVADETAKTRPTIDPRKNVRQEQEQKKTRRENIYTIPNVLTASRLVVAPFVGYYILHDEYAWALGLTAYAAVTDLLDGWIARKWNQGTIVGTVIDPMADKMLMTVLTVALAAKGTLPIWLAALVLGRDMALGIAAVYYRWISLPPPKSFSRYWDFSLPSAEVHPTTISKYNTFLQLALMGLTTAAPLLPLETGVALQAMQCVVAATTVWSGASYVFSKDAVRILKTKRVKNIKAKADQPGKS